LPNNIFVIKYNPHFLLGRCYGDKPSVK